MYLLVSKQRLSRGVTNFINQILNIILNPFCLRHHCWFYDYKSEYHSKQKPFFSRQLKLPQIQQIMQEFEKQTEIMDMKEEMMNDVIDDAMGDEDDEEET